MNPRREFRLIDGPLFVDPQNPRKVQLMAADLIRLQAMHNRDDAVQALRGEGWLLVDIMHLVPEAIALASQDVVAAEMSKP